MKKYELTDQTIEIDGVTLYRIRALRGFSTVKAGELGGWIQSEDNLSHEGDAWVSGNAWVFGKAIVSGNAQVYGNARVYGNAQVFGDARVMGNVMDLDAERVDDKARVAGDTRESYHCPNCNEVMGDPVDNLCECTNCGTMLYENALQKIANTQQQLEASNDANDKLVNESLELENKLVAARKRIKELEEFIGRARTYILDHVTESDDEPYVWMYALLNDIDRLQGKPTALERLRMAIESHTPDAESE